MIVGEHEPHRRRRPAIRVGNSSLLNDRRDRAPYRRGGEKSVSALQCSDERMLTQIGRSAPPHSQIQREVAALCCKARAAYDGLEVAI